MAQNPSLIAISHTSQFTLGLPKPVEKCCCGVASSIFALKYFMGDLKTSDTDLALDFMDSGEYTRPIIGVQFTSYPNRNFPVLLSKSYQQDDIEMAIEQAKIFLEVYSGNLKNMDYNLKVIYHNHQKYAPAFLMRSGTDVRGLSLWLSKKGLKTKIYEYREEVPQTTLDPSHQIVLKKDDFVEIFKNALLTDGSLLISSVTQSKFHYTQDVDVVKDPRFTGTHIVAATNCGTENDVVYADPAYIDGSMGVKKILLDTFLEAVINNDKKCGHFVTVGRQEIRHTK